MQPSKLVRNLSVALACSIASLISTAQAQTTATTDPVGFITLNIAGTGGAGANKISFKGLGLTRPVEYQGSAETSAQATNFIVDDQATWTTGQFEGANGSFFVEITSGTAAGTTYDVVSTDAATKKITLAQNLANGVANGTTFKVRKHWTITAVFGASNTAGLTGGEDTSTADQLLIWNGTGYTVYYYQELPPALGGTGWRSAANAFADAGGTSVYPDDGLVVKRISASNVNLVVMGAVKTGSTSFPIQSGINIVSNVYAAPMTLDSCGIVASGLTAGEDTSTADQVLLWNGSGYDVYYFQDLPPALGGQGWRSASNAFTDAGATSIGVGTSIVVKRSLGGAFDWKIPQHPATL